METNIRHSITQISALVFTVMIIVLACKQKGNPSLGDRQGSTNSIKLFKPQKAEAFCCDFSYQTKNSGGGYRLIGGGDFKEYTISPKYILKQNLLTLSLSDTAKIAPLLNILLNSTIRIDSNLYKDNRFILLFSNNGADSIYFSHLNDSNLIVNDKFVYSYPFNVMDSIFYYFNVGEIICDPYPGSIIK